MSTNITDAERADLDNRFTYHPPKDGQPTAYEHLRRSAKELAIDVLAFAPPSRETSLAITNLEEAVMWANAAIARHGLRPDENTGSPL